VVAAYPAMAGRDHAALKSIRDCAVRGPGSSLLIIHQQRRFSTGGSSRTRRVGARTSLV
jgi:hypothetical protein